MKSKNLSILLAFLLFFSIGFAFTINGTPAPQTSQTVFLNFWYTENDAEKPTLLDKIALFEAMYPNVDVIPVQKGFFGVGDEYRTAFVAGEEPDVLRTPRDDVISFAEDGLIRPLTSEFSAADLADFLPASMKLMTYKGEIWGFPQSIDCPMYLFNKEIFNASGFDASTIDWSTSWDWGQFSANIVALNASGPWYALSLAGMFFGAQPYYYGQGAYFFENDAYTRSTIAINNTKSRNALAFLKNFTASTLTPPWEEQGWGTFVGAFGRGELAMIATGPWQILDLLNNHVQFNGTTYGNNNLGFMQLPHDADDNYGALVGGQYYTISSQLNTTSQYTAAVNLAKWLSSHDAMALSAISDYHVPARLSVMSNTSVMAAPSFQYVQPYFQQAVNAYQLTPSPYYGALETAFGNRIDEYLADDINLDQLINKTIFDWYDILPAEPLPPLPFIPGYSTEMVIFTLIIGVSSVVIYILKKKNKF